MLGRLNAALVVVMTVPCDRLSCMNPNGLWETRLAIKRRWFCHAKSMSARIGLFSIWRCVAAHSCVKRDMGTWFKAHWSSSNAMCAKHQAMLHNCDPQNTDLVFCVNVTVWASYDI